MFKWIKNLFHKKENESITMDLEDFMSTSLIKIFNGIKTAQIQSSGKIDEKEQEHFNGYIVPHSPNRTDLQSFPKFYEMEFDIAVTIDKKTSSQTNIQIGAKDLQISVIGMDAKFKHTKNSDITNNMISKIKFTLPVIFPSVPNKIL